MSVTCMRERHDTHNVVQAGNGKQYTYFSPCSSNCSVRLFEDGQLLHIRDVVCESVEVFSLI